MCCADASVQLLRQAFMDTRPERRGGEKLKILITHFQIATSLKYTVNLSWPSN